MSDIIDLKKKQITIGRYKLKLIMAYPCPFGDFPLIAYWQTRDSGPGVQDIRSALDDSGFEGYRVFETEGGQGFEYDLEKDPKKRHEHDEGTYYSSVIWKPYLSLNPAFALRNLIAATTGTEVSQIEMYPVPEALGLIENMRDEESYFRVVDDIIGHGKPLFFFNWSKWADQWKYGYADRDSKMEQMQRVLGLPKANPTLEIPFESKEQLQHIQEAEKHLMGAGVSFDIGTTVRPGEEARHWELDWSLKGAQLGKPYFASPTVEELTALLKVELQELAIKRGLAKSGTKAQIAKRLVGSGIWKKENPQVTFASCFPRSKIKPIEQYVGPALTCIEELASRKIDFPSPIRCMTKKEIAEGRGIHGPGHEEGAGHGLLIWKGGEPIVKVNKTMSPMNILANVIHENLHVAFPDKHEVVIDKLTGSIMMAIKAIQANPACKANLSGVGDIIASIIIKQLISRLIGSM